MKKCLVNFATPEFYESQGRLHTSALKFGVDEVRSYNKKIIQKSLFYKENKSILDQKRGAGYFLWKAYIILDVMQHINYGDLLIYSDAGIEIVKDPLPLIDICCAQNGILLFKVHGRLNRTWTKRDCFVLMNCDSKVYWNAVQIVASFQIYIKNNRSLAFVEEWLHYCKIPEIITDLPNIQGLDNFPEFKNHRHDQSVLSLLATKHGIEIFRDPSQWGNHMKMENLREQDEFLDPAFGAVYSRAPCLNSPYPTILIQHREKGVIKKQRQQYKL